LSTTGPGVTLLLVEGAAVLVSVDELVPGRDAFEAFAGADSSAITCVSLVLFEPTPSPTTPEGLDALLVAFALPVVPDWLAFANELLLECVSLSAFCMLVAFGGLKGADDALVAFDAVLLLMVLSPGDTLLLVGGATVFVSVEEPVPGRDAFEAFAGAVSSAITPVSLVLFEPDPSPTTPAGLDALLVVL